MLMRWRRCAASSAALEPMWPADSACSPTIRTTGRGRPSPPRSGGGAERTTRSTTPSPPGRAGRRCAAQRRSSPTTPRAAAERYPPGIGICGICGTWGTGLLGGGDTVTVLVLVLTEVETDVLTLISADVVSVAGAVVSVLADGGVVSVAV